MHPQNLLVHAGKPLLAKEGSHEILPEDLMTVLWHKTQLSIFNNSDDLPETQWLLMRPNLAPID